MKRNIVAVGMLFFFSAALISCSDSSDKDPEKGLSLEESLKKKTQTLSTAVEEITNSKGYEIITVNDPNLVKAASVSGESDDTQFSANITINDVKGVYEYSPAIKTETKMGLSRKFEKTGNSENFIIKLPKEKAGKPWKLYMTEEGDANLTNDFVITTTQYNYSFSAGTSFQFTNLVNASITVEDEPAGELFVDWSISENQKFKYKSKYSFTDDYSVGVDFNTNGNIEYEYYLKKGDDVLYKEEVEFAVSEGNEPEFEYALSIGIIKIVMTSESNGYKVYRDGVLEEGAVVKVIRNTEESTESNVAFCRKGLDLKITFADETVVVLSELLGDETRNKMAEIFSSMYDMFFIKHVVNKVASEIYFMNQPL